MNKNVRKYGRLREKIKEVYGTQKAFADAMGMNVATLNAKLNSKTDWSISETEKVCNLLEIPTGEMTGYFFY